MTQGDHSSYMATELEAWGEMSRPGWGVGFWVDFSPLLSQGSVTLTARTEPATRLSCWLRSPPWGGKRRTWLWSRDSSTWATSMPRPARCVHTPSLALNPGVTSTSGAHPSLTSLP